MTKLAKEGEQYHRNSLNERKGNITLPTQLC